VRDVLPVSRDDLPVGSWWGCWEVLLSGPQTRATCHTFGSTRFRTVRREISTRSGVIDRRAIESLEILTAPSSSYRECLANREIQIQIYDLIDRSVSFVPNKWRRAGIAIELETRSDGRLDIRWTIVAAGGRNAKARSFRMLLRMFNASQRKCASRLS